MFRATLPAPPTSSSWRLTDSTGVEASRRNPRDLAIDEVVQHQVSDAEHDLLADQPERVFEIEHGLPDVCRAAATPHQYRLGWFRNDVTAI